MKEPTTIRFAEGSHAKGQVCVCSHNDLGRLTLEGWTYEASTADLMHHLLSRPRTESERQSEAEAKANAEAIRAHQRRNEIERQFFTLKAEHRETVKQLEALQDSHTKLVADRDERHALHERLKERALRMERDIGKVSEAIGKIRWMEIVGNGD